MRSIKIYMRNSGLHYEITVTKFIDVPTYYEELIYKIDLRFHFNDSNWLPNKAYTMFDADYDENICLYPINGKVLYVEAQIRTMDGFFTLDAEDTLKLFNLLDIDYIIKESEPC